jgi:hypothetical protein
MRNSFLGHVTIPNNQPVHSEDGPNAVGAYCIGPFLGEGLRSAPIIDAGRCFSLDMGWTQAEKSSLAIANSQMSLLECYCRYTAANATKFGSRDTSS